MENFNYNEKKLEYIPCNLCRSKNFEVICRKSVNNLNVHTVMCKTCSLVFISPRMTSKDYDEYYMSYYRIDRASIKQKEYINDLEKNFENARKFGKAIVKYMGEYVNDGLTIDVGSSTGGILYGLKEARGNLELLGIEPSLEESAYAESKGVKTIRGLFEDVKLDIKNKASNVLCVQSLNHLLDPKKFLDWSYDILNENGHVFLAVKNWRHQVYRAGKLKYGIQIDHVYMFTPETLSLLCKSAGFEVIYIDMDESKSREEIKKQKADGLNTHHIRIVAKKSLKNQNLHIPKNQYLKTRLQLHPIIVKLVYIFRYSKRLAFFRKILHIR
jgi:SAM-dependent methyltransferase